MQICELDAEGRTNNTRFSSPIFRISHYHWSNWPDCILESPAVMLLFRLVQKEQCYIKKMNLTFRRIYAISIYASYLSFFAHIFCCNAIMAVRNAACFVGWRGSSPPKPARRCPLWTTSLKRSSGFGAHCASLDMHFANPAGSSGAMKISVAIWSLIRAWTS